MDSIGTSSSLHCSALIGARFPNATALNLIGKPASWSYAECPDVEECRLGLHDCHKDADCTNTRHGFNCTCRRGFAGDGRDACEKTCYHDCVHGRCSNAPDYKCLCDIGWTGMDGNVSLFSLNSMAFSPCLSDSGMPRHLLCYRRRLRSGLRLQQSQHVRVGESIS